MKNKKPTHTTKVGMFTYHWYIDKKHSFIDEKFSENSYLVIKMNDTFSIRIGSNHEAFGLLLIADQEKMYKMMEIYPAMVYSTTHLLATDTAFVPDLTNLIACTVQRRIEEAESSASEISDTEEQAAQAFMEDVVDYSEASEEERKKMSGEFKEAVKSELNNLDTWEKQETT